MNFKVFIFFFVSQLFQVSHSFVLTPKNSKAQCPIKNAKNVYASYEHIVLCGGSEPLQFPKTLDEVSSILRRASSSGVKVKVVGALHSMTDAICTDGIPISLSKMKLSESDYRYDEEEETFTVPSWIPVQAALEMMEMFGRSLIHIPGYGGITIGGAIGTGAHGSSLRHPPTISDQVVRLTILDSEGELRVIDDPEELRAARIHLGLLGVVINVTLKTVPLFKMTLLHTQHSDYTLLNGEVAEGSKTADYFTIYWFPLNKQIVVVNGTYKPIETPGNAITNHIDEWDDFIGITGAAMYEGAYMMDNHKTFKTIEQMSQQWFMEDTKMRTPIMSEEDGSFQNPATGITWKLLSSVCSPGTCFYDYVRFVDFEIAFDMSSFNDVVGTISKAIESPDSDFLRMVGFIFRFLKGSDALMSKTNGNDSFVVEWYVPTRWMMRRRSQTGLDNMEHLIRTLIQKHNGRPHWGKGSLCFSDATKFEGRESFTKAMKKADPEGRFMNDFGLRLTHPKLISHHPSCSRPTRDICAADSTCRTEFQFCKTAKFSSICNERDLPYICAVKLLRSQVPFAPAKIWETFANFSRNANIRIK